MLNLMFFTKIVPETYYLDILGCNLKLLLLSDIIACEYGCLSPASDVIFIKYHLHLMAKAFESGTLTNMYLGSRGNLA